VVVSRQIFYAAMAVVIGWSFSADAAVRIEGAHGMEHVWSLAWSPDGSSLLTAGSDRIAKVWNAETGSCDQLLDGSSEILRIAVYSPDGSQVATASWDGEVELWNLDSGTVARFFSAHRGDCNTVAFSPDGALLLTTGRDLTAKLWGAESGEFLQSFKHPASVSTALFSPDGNRILTGCSDGVVRLWEVSSGEVIQSYGGGAGDVRCALFSPDGKQILTSAFEEREACLWDAEGGQLIRMFSGHSGRISCAVFSPDGTRVLTGSHDNTARLWDVATGQDLGVFSLHERYITGVSISPDGQSMASVDVRGNLWLWEESDTAEILPTFPSVLAASAEESFSEPIMMASTATPPIPIMGTASNDTLYGTPGDDVIDGGEGADTMIGLAGDDYYHVDHELDDVVEKPDEGFDTVELRYCMWTNAASGLVPTVYTGPTNVEMIVLGDDDYDAIETQSNHIAVVYGDPMDWRDSLDDFQGDNARGWQETCTMTSVANALTMLGYDVTEDDVVEYAFENDLYGDVNRGFASPEQVQMTLEGFGTTVTRTPSRPVSEIAVFLEEGKAIIIGVDYGVLNLSSPRGYDDHAVALTGVAYDPETGEVEGFYYCDSGDYDDPSAAHLMTTNVFYLANQQYAAETLVIDSPLKVQRDNLRISGTPGMDCILIGNRGDNVFWTENGSDYVEGGAGSDVFHDLAGGDDTFAPGAGDDFVFSSFGRDTFVISANGGVDEILDSDPAVDWVAFDVSVDIETVSFAYDGTNLFLDHGSNSTVSLVQYSDFSAFGVTAADGLALEPAALSNLIVQMENYCTVNGVDFSSIAAVRADTNLTAMVSASWQIDTNPVAYRAWAAIQGVPYGAQGEADSPAGDGIGNLLKYAAGLSPMEYSSFDRLYTFVPDRAGQRFTIFYNQSKRARASLVPEWTDSLTNAWQTAGIDKAMATETISNETWEASVSLGQSGFMRLRAELEE